MARVGILIAIVAVAVALVILVPGRGRAHRVHAEGAVTSSAGTAVESPRPDAAGGGVLAVVVGAGLLAGWLVLVTIQLRRGRIALAKTSHPADQASELLR